MVMVKRVNYAPLLIPTENLVDVTFTRHKMQFLSGRYIYLSQNARTCWTLPLLVTKCKVLVDATFTCHKMQGLGGRYRYSSQNARS